jgi:glucose-6-phosphate isomerase/transaldolase/glucose-6-phosphate isomerase
MQAHADALARLSADVGSGVIRDVVLLGMGGSSLGAEVLNQVFGPAAGQPRLHVLDSTAPGAVRAVADAIDFARTLFIVSSKSGGTLEPNLLYEYFSAEAATRNGRSAGEQCIAITDAGTSLERLARKAGFRHVFTNPSDVGGRYSVLSLFGLVPGATLGMNLPLLLTRARQMARQCGPDAPAQGNPGAQLGAYLAGCARLGRDKLTLITSPALASFGLWAEQLIAESTGKDGKGIVPVVGEPEFDTVDYRSDRAFVYLRLNDDNNDATDNRVWKSADAGFPCMTVAAEDAYSLGAEFFRWQFATATAGALLRVNPFDQPDVQRAKDASTRVLADYLARGSLPRVEAPDTPAGLSARLRAGTYFGVMAYLRQRPDVDDIITTFRHRLGSHHRVSTTIGYGPRFLHSTGQLHKGGPNEGVFLQIVSAHPDDLPVPGSKYSFGVVVDAQAMGDLQALVALGRPVARVVLERDDPELLARALESVS